MKHFPRSFTTNIQIVVKGAAVEYNLLIKTLCIRKE